MFIRQLCKASCNCTVVATCNIQERPQCDPVQLMCRLQMHTAIGRRHVLMPVNIHMITQHGTSCANGAIACAPN
jgi:hypothetical protein